MLKIHIQPSIKPAFNEEMLLETHNLLINTWWPINSIVLCYTLVYESEQKDKFIAFIFGARSATPDLVILVQKS